MRLSGSNVPPNNEHGRLGGTIPIVASDLSRSTETDRGSYLGIDFSGDQGQWSATRNTSNVWVARTELDGGVLSLVSLTRVQDLSPSLGNRPFDRLCGLLGSGRFSVAAIDAPFSLPRSRMKQGESPLTHLELLNLVDGIDSPERDFPPGEDLITLFAAELAPRGRKDFRLTERVWPVTTRSTIWNGPRGGAPMAMACFKLLAKTRRPMWPWDSDSDGRIVEAFPAAQLRHWNLPHTSYNGVKTEATETRLAILNGVERQLGSRGLRLDVDHTQQEIMIGSADALDAVVCAVAAVAVGRGQTAKDAQRREAAEPATEGWIAVYD